MSITQHLTRFLLHGVGAVCWLLWSAVVIAAGDGMLWKLESGNGTTSYLFGTIHVDDLQVTALAEPVQQALEQAELFMMEVLPSSDVSPYFMAGSLTALLTAAELEQVQALAEVHGLPKDLVLRMKPWLLAMVFDLPVAQSPYTLDVQLYLQAQRLGKMTLALESPDEHFAALESISLDEQLMLLRSVLARTQAQKEADFELLIQAYLAGDLEKVGMLDEQVTGDGLPEGLWEKLRNMLLDERNVQMVSRIIEASSRQSVFVAVGAAHLPGNAGLIHLLRQAGFQVTPVQ